MIISIETGSIIKYFNSAAPVGWTKLTTYDDCCLRVVSGAASTGGTKAFSTVFTDQPASGEVVVGPASVGATLSTVASHQHKYTFQGGSSAGYVPTSFSGSTYPVYGPNGGSYTSGPAGSNGTHGHPISPNGPIAVAGTFNIAVKYVDAILAQRN